MEVDVNDIAYNIFHPKRTVCTAIFVYGPQSVGKTPKVINLSKREGTQMMNEKVIEHLKKNYVTNKWNDLVKVYGRSKDGKKVRVRGGWVVMKDNDGDRLEELKEANYENALREERRQTLIHALQWWDGCAGEENVKAVGKMVQDALKEQTMEKIYLDRGIPEDLKQVMELLDLLF